MLFNNLAFLPGWLFLDVAWLFSQKVSGNPAAAHYSQRQKLLYGHRSKWPVRH